jgi:hypothetical protein
MILTNVNRQIYACRRQTAIAGVPPAFLAPPKIQRTDGPKSTPLPTLATTP